MLSMKLATACLLGLFLLYYPVDLMLCHCVSLDEAMASWKNFFLCFSFYKSLKCYVVKWSLLYGALHVLGDSFTHLQEHSDCIYTERSGRWAKLSPKTCRASLKESIKQILLYLVGFWHHCKNNTLTMHINLLAPELYFWFLHTMYMKCE